METRYCSTGWVLIVSIVVGFADSSAVADIPRLIHYQGKLRQANGAVVDGAVSLRFRLYDNDAGTGSPLFDEMHGSVTVENGLFSVLIGANAGGVSDAALDAAEVFLGISVDGGIELTPRTRVATTPHAIKSRSAEQLVEPNTFDPVVEVDGSGNVGVGTSSPQGKLDVNGTLAVAGSTGAANQVLTSQGPSAAPIWADTASGSPTQLVREFVVASGFSFNAGEVASLRNNGEIAKGVGVPASTEYVFNAAVTENITAAGMTSTKFVVTYRDAGNSNQGTARIGDISGTTITYGAEYVFNAAATDRPSVAALSATQFVVAYTDEGNAERGTAVIGTVTGNTISFGSEFVFNAASTAWCSPIGLSSNKFAVSYRDGGNGNFGTAVIGDVSGSAITYGSEYVFNSASSVYISTLALDSGKIVAVYQDSGNAEQGTAAVGTVSGTSITFGSEYIFNSHGSGSTYYISAAALDTSRFLIAYLDSSSGSPIGTSIAGSASGTTISYGAEHVFEPGSAEDKKVIVLGPANFAIIYTDGSNGNKGTVVMGSAVGSVITTGQENVFDTDISFAMSGASLSATQFIAAWPQYSQYQGRVMLFGPLSGADSIVGVAAEAGTAGQSIPVIVGGVSDVHAGLSVGQVYYADDIDGSLITTSNEYRVGVAISSSEILLNSNRDNANQFFGDMVFANDFRITEASGPVHGLIFKNQHGDEIHALDESGNVGIGTMAPRHRIDVDGGAYTDGNVWVNAASQADATDVKDLDVAEAIATLGGLNPVRFRYASNPDEEYAGFMAEESPPLVTTDDRQGMSAMDVAAVLTRVVQQQQEVIARLERESQAQRKISERQQQEIEALRRTVIRERNRSRK